MSVRSQYTVCNHKCACQLQAELDKSELALSEQESALIRLRHQVRDLEMKLQYEQSVKRPMPANPQSYLATPEREDLRAFPRLEPLKRNYDSMNDSQTAMVRVNTESPRQSPAPAEIRPQVVKTERPNFNAHPYPSNAQPSVPQFMEPQLGHSPIVAPQPPVSSSNSPSFETNSLAQTPVQALVRVNKSNCTPRVCMSCKTTNSACWRGSWGKGNLCNSCGLKYKKIKAYCGTCARIPSKTEMSSHPVPACHCGGVFIVG